MIRLNLGCGHSRLNGWINCDLHPAPNVDRVFDVQQKPWPFPDKSVVEIYASHLVEHLTDFEAFFEEAWRVMTPLASMLLRMPYGASRGAWWDTTHIRPWFPECFCGLQPRYDAAVGNRQYDGKERAFWVTESLIFIGGRWARLYRVPGLKRFVWWCVKHLYDVGEEMWVMLQRTTQDTGWEHNHPCAVPVQLAVTGKALGYPTTNGETQVYRLANPLSLRYQYAKVTWGNIIEEVQYIAELPLNTIQPFDAFHQSDGNSGFVCTSPEDTQTHIQTIEYARTLLRQNKRMRPIAVTSDHYNRYTRLDGFSRYWAHALEGKQTIWAIILPKPAPGCQHGQTMELEEAEWNMIESSHLPLPKGTTSTIKVRL